MKKDINEIALEAFATAATSVESGTIIQIMTEREKIAIGRRLLIAQAILAGKTRFEINEQIRVSPNTFAQINRWLEADLGEYMSAHNNNQQKSNKDKPRNTQPFSYEDLKKKYPAHFLLFSLVEQIWKEK